MATRLYIKENTLIKQLNNDNGFVVDARNVKFDDTMSVVDKINSLSSFSPTLNGSGEKLLWLGGSISPTTITSGNTGTLNKGQILAKYTDNYYKDITSSVVFSVSDGSISGTSITPPTLNSGTQIITLTASYTEGSITQTTKKTYTAKAAQQTQLTLSSTLGSIIRPKGSLSSISANGGSDNITITVGSTANITAPTSLTLTYDANTNKTASTPIATYNGTSVTPTWTSSDTSVATVSGTTITAKAAGSVTLIASYDGKTATYNLTVTNESTSGSATSDWTYTSASTSIVTISGTTVTGVAQGTTHIKVNYGGKTCDLPGTVTVNAAAPVNNYLG